MIVIILTALRISSGLIELRFSAETLLTDIEKVL